MTRLTESTPADPAAMRRTRPAVPGHGCRSLALWGLLALISGCSAIGESFDASNAHLIRNGMTRDEVIALMGTPPSTVEGADPGTLLWIDASADALGYHEQRVRFSFDEHDRVYGLPK